MSLAGDEHDLTSPESTKSSAENEQSTIARSLETIVHHAAAA